MQRNFMKKLVHRWNISYNGKKLQFYIDVMKMRWRREIVTKEIEMVKLFQF